MINVDKNDSYPPAVRTLKKDKIFPEKTKLQQENFLNNLIEQDHPGVKHLINPNMFFCSFNSARRSIRGYEAMNMIRKGQIKNVEKGDIVGQASFINEIFELAA